jgi:hypothetical protein
MLAAVVKPQNVLQSAAGMYADSDWKIFPVYGVRKEGGTYICTCKAGRVCPYAGKHPIPDRGFHAATADVNTVRDWWDEYPDANIGMPMRANGLVAFDFDPRAGGVSSSATLEAKYGAFPQTVKQVSGGGGWHLIFLDNPRIEFPSKLAEGIDIKSSGYIVVAPSTHLSGKAYQWDECLLPERDKILPLPTIWMQHVIKRLKQNRVTRSFSLPATVADGEGREAMILKFAGHLRAKGVSQEDINAKVLEYNAKHIDPPLAEDKVLDRAERYEQVGVNIDPWLADMNADYAWIEENTSIYRLGDGKFIDHRPFRIQHDNREISLPDGNRIKSVGAGTAWLKHPQRAQFRRLVLRPGETRVTTDGCLNEWGGFAVECRQGDVDPWLDLLYRLVPDSSARLYVLQWLAHLIQHPGNKIFSSIVMWSLEQGVGKNLLFEPIKSIIGDRHAATIEQQHLADTFNAWVPNKIFVIGDEVIAEDTRKHADKLKGWITGSTITVNAKYQTAREIPNYLNFVFLSNHADAVFVEDHDRRFFVWEVKAGRLSDVVASAFVQWRNNGGLEALREFLETCECSQFQPKAPAPMTAAKREMVEDNRSDLERWLADLMASDPKVIGKECFTANELARRYNTEQQRRGTPPSTKAVTSACKRLGAFVRPNQVRLSDGRKLRAMALFRQQHWASQSDALWAAELEKLLNLRSLLQACLE